MSFIFFNQFKYLYKKWPLLPFRNHPHLWLMLSPILLINSACIIVFANIFSGPFDRASTLDIFLDNCKYVPPFRTKRLRESTSRKKVNSMRLTKSGVSLLSSVLAWSAWLRCQFVMYLDYMSAIYTQMALSEGMSATSISLYSLSTKIELSL